MRGRQRKVDSLDNSTPVARRGRKARSLRLEIVRLPKVKEGRAQARFSARVHRRLRAPHPIQDAEGSMMNTVNEERVLAAPMRLVAETRADFRNAAVSLIEQVKHDARSVTLDLAATRELDATGLGTLVAIQSRAKQYRIGVRLVNVTDEVYTLLALTELVQLFVIERA